MDSTPFNQSSDPPKEPGILVINESAPPVESPTPAPAAPAKPPSAHPILYPGLTWLLGLLIGVVILRYFVPYFAEQIQYAIVRGEERAKYDVAGEYLQQTSLGELSMAYQLVSKRVAPSVVHIRTASYVVDVPEDEQRFPGIRQPRETRGQGSGVIVDEEGYLLTNFHVIYNAAELEVQLSDGRIVPGKVIGEDHETDLAVVKIEADNLTPIEWGDSDEAEVGSLVWAVGSPFGLEKSITSGILSAKGRSGIAQSNYQEFLQTDAAVNPGNSGGPLVDVHGRLIGINTAIIGESFQGVSFSLASNIAKDVYEQLKANPKVTRGWLGVGLAEVTDGVAADRGMPEATGVLVENVVDMPRHPSPAKTAGIRAGDVILTWDGTVVESRRDLILAVGGTSPGEEVDVTLWRDGGEVTVQVTVGKRMI